jgi:hypothetical protein
MIHLAPLPGGGIGSADVEVPAAVVQLEQQQQDQKLDFLGPLLPPEVARGIAEGTPTGPAKIMAAGIVAQRRHPRVGMYSCSRRSAAGSLEACLHVHLWLVRLNASIPDCIHLRLS